MLVVAAIVLVARTLAYALAPDPRAEALGQVTGGPRPVVIAAVVLALSAVFAGAVLWLSALGVRERHRLRPGSGEAPHLRLLPMLLRGAALFVVSALVFTRRRVDDPRRGGARLPRASLPARAGSPERASAARRTRTRRRRADRGGAPRHRLRATRRGGEPTSPARSPSARDDTGRARRGRVARPRHHRRTRRPRPARSLALLSPCGAGAATHRNEGVPPDVESHATASGRRDPGCHGRRPRDVRACVRARHHVAPGRPGEGPAAVHAVRADREGGREDDEDRAHGSERLRRRLLRGRARLEAHGRGDGQRR